MKPEHIIAKEEGYREAPYYDHLGFPTVGYGRLLGLRHSALSNYTGVIYEPAELTNFAAATIGYIGQQEFGKLALKFLNRKIG